MREISKIRRDQEHAEVAELVAVDLLKAENGHD
jgi:hypothetical protein